MDAKNVAYLPDCFSTVYSQYKLPGLRKSAAIWHNCRCVTCIPVIAWALHTSWHICRTRRFPTKSSVEFALLVEFSVRLGLLVSQKSKKFLLFKHFNRSAAVYNYMLILKLATWVGSGQRGQDCCNIPFIAKTTETYRLITNRRVDLFTCRIHDI